ncbi:Dabb family protein [Pontibacter silvestris]|uniref:Dabb family protein n=1 Tax=Pontibacter silvestris TaxID=2305183 RepID=A0ABW4WZR5_9BACT|nr:Dabb family protein [Pontibacter silvestris]MCC9135671.1 Dabb family protein [Pontibacter silvestris]
MFVHHVFFWLKNPDSSDERAKLLDGIKQLKAVETVKTFHVGVPATTNRPVIERGYSFSLLLIFDNLEDQDTYQVHPIHKNFVEECSPLWSKVVIYDAVDT